MNDNYYDEEDDQYDLYSSLPGGAADFSDHQISTSVDADPFTQGVAATGKAKNPYSVRGELLRTQADAVSKDAMETLDRALKNQANVSAEQGLAAALLAVIPTIGGGIIGRSIGKPKLPKGTFGVDLQETGMSAGAQTGLAGGLKASQGYLKSLEPSKEQNEALLRMAQYKNRNAAQLLNQANQTEMAGVNAERDQAMLAARGVQQKELIDYKAQHSPASQMSENEKVQAGLSTLKQTNPALFQKVMGDVNSLTPEEKLQLPDSLNKVILDKTSQAKPFSFDNFPAEIQSRIFKAKPIIKGARSIAEEIMTLKPGVGQFQAMTRFSGMDTEGIGLELKILADGLARARSGAALNPTEVDLYDRMVKGDGSALDPQQVAKLLIKLSDIEAQNTLSMIEVGEAASQGLDPLKEIFTTYKNPNQAKVDANNARIAALKAKLQGAP